MADPYVLPNGTLRNRFGLHDPNQLQRAETDLVKARLQLLESEGPRGPYNFERLKATHHYLFQDVYTWAGSPRTTPLLKEEFVGGPVHVFTPPGRIDARARETFARLPEPAALRAYAPDAFARELADRFADVNQLHAFREGNGRTQRAFFLALAREAGRDLAFDVVSRERMTEASIQAGRGEPDLMRRLFREISDPARVRPLRDAIRFFEAHRYDWHSRYLATTEPGRFYDGTFVGRDQNHFLMHDGRRILVGSVGDLRRVPAPGEPVSFSTGSPPHAERRHRDRDPRGDRGP